MGIRAGLILLPALLVACGGGGRSAKRPAWLGTGLNPGVALALAEGDDPELRRAAVAGLIANLASDRPEVRGSAAEALGVLRLDAEAVVPELLRLLEDEDDAVRREAACAILRIAPDTPGALETALLHDLDAEEVLWETAPFLLDGLARLAVSADEDLSDAATRCLALLGPGAASCAPALIEGLRSPHEFVRQECALTLPRIAPDRPEPAAVLSEILREGPDWRRELAAERIAALGEAGRGALDALLDALDDPSARVARAAVRALARSGAPPATVVAALAPRLEGKDRGAALGAALALAKLGPPAEAAVPLLLASLRSNPPGLHFQETHGLTAIGSAAVPGILECMKTDDEEVRRSSIGILSSMGPKAARAVPALRALAEDPVLGVEASLAWSRAAPGSREAAEAFAAALLRAMEDCDDTYWVEIHARRGDDQLVPGLRAAERRTRDSESRLALRGAIFAVTGDARLVLSLSLPDLTAQALREDPIPFSILENLEAEGRPAVPTLLRLLESAEGDLVEGVLYCLFAVQPRTGDAALALGRYVNHEDKSIREIALETLLEMGAAAGPAGPDLERAGRRIGSGTDSLARRVLVRIRAGIEPTDR